MLFHCFLSARIPSYVVSSWNINALLVGDTRRFDTDIFQPFIGYMSDLQFNDEYLFQSLTTRKGKIQSSFYTHSRHILVGYHIAFFNLVTIDTQTSHIAFSEWENQNKNYGKSDIYFLFRSYVPDGIILYRYAQGLNEYFAIGLRAGILALYVDFGFGKRQVISDESTKLSDGKWHEVRVTRIGIDKIELVVDNRVNLTTLSANGIRNAVSLQPVLYIGGIPNNDINNLTGSGLSSYGFQGCLSSFIVDGRILDYQTALSIYGSVKVNVCSDLNKLCYDFTCVHSGVCTSTERDGAKCDCIETGYVGERCDKLPNGFYFGKHNAAGALEYIVHSAHQIEHDTISFGLQTLSMSAHIFRLQSDSKKYSLEYELVGGRSYIKLNFGESQPAYYPGVIRVSDGLYHVIKIVRNVTAIKLYIDGAEIKLLGSNKHLEPLDQRSSLTPLRLRIGSFTNTSRWNGIVAGFSFNRQSIFDSLNRTLIRLGDVEEVHPNPYLSQFDLVHSSFMPTFTQTSTRTVPIVTNETFSLDSSATTAFIPIEDDQQRTERINTKHIIAPIPIPPEGLVTKWFSNQVTRFGVRGLLIGAIIASCFLLFLIFIFIRLHCTSRHSRRKHSPYSYTESNGKTYTHLQQQTNRSATPSSDDRESKKSTPKLLRYLSPNESKSPSYRLSDNGGDDSHLISSTKENSTLPYRNSDCVLNEHCCIHTSLSQPETSTSMYHQVNRLISLDSDPPLPLPHLSHSHSHLPTTATLRSLKKDQDHTSTQTYSAVYSCDLAANLDIEQDIAQKRSSIKRRSILKNNNSISTQTKILFLYTKNPVDCYALQTCQKTTQEPLLLATANENRIQLAQAQTGSFHSQLPVSSVGSCHDILFSSDGQFLIGLFYEVSSNVNPYAVKIWSTDTYTIRTSPHPIKCTIAAASQHLPVLYMAGKQKYGRGISLGLLEIDSCSLARELKSDPDTPIGDEIQRIILTRNESYVVVVCTEHASSYTCFVVFKLETLSMITQEQKVGSTSNCTMILTRFECDPTYTFPINDSNNNDDEQILTILHMNQIIIWKLNDGEIMFNHDFRHLNTDNQKQQVQNCQMHNNRLFVQVEHGLVHIWDVTLVMGQISLIATISDPLIHSITWLDQRHFLSIDTDGYRLRTWNIHRKDVLNEFISSIDKIKSLHVHSIRSDSSKRQEYLIIGKSITERYLSVFEYTQPHEDISASLVS
ncbi:unnamed protein product [Adineta ricciae]|uniref:Uncharacterized protein n=1 Tax=Adineta ricciae TaxID=249248 RepID=A0A816AEB3_ADIRI|nr:unnamed protein product [Adineta ricciae]